jgi:hypothetical protein
MGKNASSCLGRGDRETSTPPPTASQDLIANLPARRPFATYIRIGPNKQDSFQVQD